MYWGQVATALTVAVAAAFALLFASLSTVVAAATAVLVYVVVRWALAWVFRVRHWVERDTRGTYSRECPNCHARRHRLGGDWILTCRSCGWRPGPPAVRWLTRSVPARQLRKTVVGPHLVAVVLAGAVLAGAAAGLSPGVVLPAGGVEPGMLADETAGPVAGAVTPTDRPTPTPTATPVPDDDGDRINDTLVRGVFQSYLNAERASRGLENLTLRPELTAMGKAQAANMANHEYVGHVQPDGTDIRDRYEARGLLPECRLERRETDRYYPGAENAAQTWINRSVRTDDGLDYIGDEYDLGEELFEMWINSPPHREAMLVSAADEMGLGLNVTANGRVYAALELC
jgi:uncharacterized protein YkwD